MPETTFVMLLLAFGTELNSRSSRAIHDGQKSFGYVLCFASERPSPHQNTMCDLISSFLALHFMMLSLKYAIVVFFGMNKTSWTHDSARISFWPNGVIL